ncbi:hypothetical protein ABT369_17220 [Dactylosporangium sp. NPDC000244]|uniref:zinc finger domain-containing protein n=1 Tax=Dactylosporangium sp. NPDC000244 TaxID=3154365 RepID=UPI0033192B89
MPPRGTRAIRCSICQAVTPLTTTVSASAGSTPSGTGTRSPASTSAAVAQPPVFVTAATRVPTSAPSTPGPTRSTRPTRS